jgi:hypothetical protein
MSIALRVAMPTRLHVVLAAIDLDHEASGEAGDVHDEVVDWDLTTEVDTLGLERAQIPPQLSFGVRLVSA